MDAHYIIAVHLYEKCTKICITYSSSKFSKLCSKDQLTLWFQSIPLSLYRWLTGQYLLPY